MAEEFDEQLEDEGDDLAELEQSLNVEIHDDDEEEAALPLEEIEQQLALLAAPAAGSEQFGFRSAAAKVREFPRTPGVYIMKDSAQRVIYVGKAKNLRARAGSYFLQAARGDKRTFWVTEISDIDFLACDSEVDALLMESRLIKDVQPKYNKDLKDDKTFPYLVVTTREDFPRVYISRNPPDRGAKVYGPFTNVGSLRGALQALQKIFKFRTCSLDIEENDERWRWFRPCLLASIRQCTAPCNFRISKDDYRRDIQRLQRVLEGNRKTLMGELQTEMQTAATERLFEKAARLRDEIRMLQRLDERGEIDRHVQPEVFYIDPKKGLAGLKKVLKLEQMPRTVEGVDIAHLGGGETVASVVQFLDGLPFKPGYRRYKIQGVVGIDDFRSIHEVISRRYKRLSEELQTFPDILLIDGGRGQLNAALAAFRDIEVTPPTLISLAKREEEIYLPTAELPLKLSRHSFALRLLQYVRDEAHRFAQHYHHILRRKSQLGGS